ncbi:M20 family metallopeptidase [Microlunatus sp. Gsoil 973]|uniref:M20 family metallopeptidase n=1 Tax=Microlunatus sp. Gsoil 973 TaxID=2672569 RepID=UPI0012B4A3D5|nr:M20 family metallopeptidase [Microlunatus sp. Gsoil 973]QGN34319.1 M20/M25/M40 family metallo-hydrolase [Microlunatus sp. Gsoil 973]
MINGPTDQLADRLDQLRPDLDQLVAELIAINSQIPPHGDEQAIVEFLREYLHGHGLGAGTVLSKEPSRPNLVLRIQGDQPGPVLGLCGHVDTKPVGDAAEQWRTEPLVATDVDGMIFGLGASDMKAAVAAMVTAARAAHDVGAINKGALELILVADEEAGATYGSRWLAPQLSDLDACVIGEPSGWERDWQGLHLISRGLSCFRIRVAGTQRHSSLSDRLPSINASLQLARLMIEMNESMRLSYPKQLFGELRPTVNPGVLLHGGVFFGVVPGEATFGCDVRTVPGMTYEQLSDDLRRWLRRASERLGIDAELEFEPGLTWIDPSTVPAESPIVRAAQRACRRALGEAPPLSFFPGTTDAPWFTAAGVPTIPSLGPGILTYCHGPNEAVSARSVHQAAAIYAHLVADFLGDQSSSTIMA